MISLSRAFASTCGCESSCSSRETARIVDVGHYRLGRAWPDPGDRSQQGDARIELGHGLQFTLHTFDPFRGPL